MSIFRKSNRSEAKELKNSELAKILQLNPRYFEEIENIKIRRIVNGYM